MSADFRFFPQLLGEVVDMVRAEYDPTDGLLPYYSYGTYLELLERCKVMDNNQVEKYPLIWLVWDGNDNQIKWTEPYIYSYSPTVYIIGTTKDEYTTEERYENTLGLILYAIFDLLVDNITYHKNISYPDSFKYPVNDHPFWLNNAEGTFDVLSAIQVKFEELTMYKD